MFAVERIGSWVYTAAGPFHPFGGAVDIIVVEQPDGSFKSSPWYVRFGKFQGVLKTREKVVSINVNGVDANFHMHLDGRGAAYFLREVEGSEGESLSSPLSSGHERASPRSPMKSKSFNYDGSTPNSSVQNDSSNGKVVPRTNSQLIEGSNGKVMAQTNSQRSRIMGLVFGRRSIMEGSHREGDDDAARRSSLDRAQIAADLLEVQWSTSLATSALGKPNASQLTDSGKLDVEGDKAVGANTESNQVNSSLHDTSETCVDHRYTFTQESSSSNVAIGNCSQSGTDSSEFSVPEACVDVPGFDTSGQVVETSSIDGFFFEDKDGLTSAFSIVIEEAALMNNYFVGKAEGVIHEIPTHDSQIPDVLKASSVENHDEHSTSDERDAPSFGVKGEESGFEKVQSVINVETSETSIVEVKDSSEQALEAVYLDCGGHREVCPPTEKLHATDELLPQETSVDRDCTLIVESTFSNTDVGNDSPSGIVSGEFPVREACVCMPGFDTLEKVVEISRIDEIVLGDKDGWTLEISTDVAEPTLTIPNFDGKGEGFVHEITTHDSPIPDMLNACSVENHDENSTSDEREAPSFGIQGEENGFGKVQSIRYVETAETSIMDVNDSSKQAQEAGYLVGGGHSEACPPTEKLHATDELLPQDLVTRPPKGMELETKYIEAFDNYCQQIDSSSCMNDHDEVNLDLSVTVSKSSTQVVSVDSAEVVDSKSISTSSSTCNSSHQIQIEKSADEIITKELGASFDSSCDSEQGVHGSGETSSVPSSESSEEDQFLFSDLDEGKLNEIQDKSNFPAPEGIQEVNGSFDANDESCSSPKMLVEEKNQLPDFVNLMGNSKMMSSSIGVPIAHNAAGVGWLAQSLPSTWAHPDRLDTGGFRHTLSHSVDSNCSLEWSLDCKEALFHGSLESENQLVQDLSDEEDTQNSNIKSDVTKPAAGDPSKAQTTSGGSWGLWPFNFRRSISSEAMQPPSNDTTVQPPSIDTAVQSPSNDTAVQPPSNDTTVQPPLIDMRPPSHDNTVQPPLNDTTVQPPLNDTTVQPPLNDTTMQPPLTGIVVQPPFNDTTIQQIQNDTTMLPTDTAMQPTLNNARNSDAENVSEGMIDMNGNKNVLERKVRKNFVRALSPTSEQLASLNLKEGRNVVTFTFSTAMLGKQQVDARIYLWKWNTRIVISDVDGTITKSDVLGQFMPLVGVDWSQTGVTHLFSAIKENGYQLLFLSARAISQAHLTRQFLFNLKQDGKTLPDGPVVISPDGLFPSLFREVIRRAPHEFKIACLEDIKALFPVDCNPFYAGFGNRDTDEISYMKVGIPKGKIFTINAKGQVAVNRRVDTRSYTSLHTLVHGMFPSTASFEQEDFNSWNFWRLPPADI